MAPSYEFSLRADFTLGHCGTGRDEGWDYRPHVLRTIPFRVARHHLRFILVFSFFVQIQVIPISRLTHEPQQLIGIA
jgi:hypothetical protein